MTSPTAALGSLLTDIQPGFASGDDLAEGIFQIRMNNLSRSGELLLDKRRRVSPDAKKISKCLLEPGDVLFNATNSPELVGKTAYFSGCDEPTVFSNHFIRLRTHEDRLDSLYLTRWLHREFQRGYFRAKAKQWVNQATFGQDRLVQMQIPLPPIEDQRRITAVLDAAEALRAKRREALAKLDSLAQAIFADMFIGPQSASRWPIVTLGEVCQAKGEYGANVPSQEFDGSRPRYLRITDIRDDGSLIEEAVAPGGQENEWKSKFLRPGDLVFARSGATVGKTFLAREDSDPLVFAGYLIRFVPDQQRVMPEYLYEFTRTGKYRAWVEKAATTVAQPNINAKRYGRLEMPLPPLDDQRRFSSVVQEIRRSSQTLKA